MRSEHDLLATIREARRRPAAHRPPHARPAGDLERVPVPASDSDVPRDLLLAQKPSTVTQIGLACGSSAFAIAQALVTAGSSGARHLILDACQQHLDGSG
jgi:hypothetical protein